MANSKNNEKNYLKMEKNKTKLENNHKIDK
jgi:hypothetical protein